MIRVFKSGEVARADILYRGESGSTQAVEDAVADILADVKKNGDAAVLRYCEKFDGVKLAGLRVAQADIDAAYEAALAAGATSHIPPKDFVIQAETPLPVRLAFVRGLNGELLEFFHEK